MGIEKIDTNFVQAEFVEDGDKRKYTIPCGGFDLYGVFYDKERGRFMRMDGEVADKVSPGVSYLAKQTSGGRVRFATDSKRIGISVEYSSLDKLPHMPLTGSCGFTLVEKTGDIYKMHYTLRPQYTDEHGYTGEATIYTDGVHELILYFPLYNDITKLEIYLDKDAVLYEPEKYRDVKPIVYYGSSIDQGGCASRPDLSYPAIISKWNDIDFVNLGFSGNAKGETLMAEYLTTLDGSMLVMSYDCNAPSVEYLENTHFNFYQTYRAARADVPIVFISVPSFDGVRDAAERREVIKRSYMKAKEMGDEKVYFLDGETLFGERDRELCTVEGLHPNDLGFYRIAEHLFELFGEIGKDFVK